MKLFEKCFINLTGTILCVNRVTVPPVQAVATLRTRAVVLTDHTVARDVVAGIRVLHIDVTATFTWFAGVIDGCGVAVIPRGTPITWLYSSLKHSYA